MKVLAWRFVRPLMLFVGIGLLWLGLIGLSGCAAAPLLGEVTASAERYEPGTGAPLAISYEIGRAALVDIYVLDAAGQRYDLRRRSRGLQPLTRMCCALMAVCRPMIHRCCAGCCLPASIRW